MSAAPADPARPASGEPSRTESAEAAALDGRRSTRTLRAEFFLPPGKIYSMAIRLGCFRVAPKPRSRARSTVAHLGIDGWNGHHRSVRLR